MEDQIIELKEVLQLTRDMLIDVCPIEFKNDPALVEVLNKCDACLDDD